MTNIIFSRKEFEKQIKITSEVQDKITAFGTPLESVNQESIEIEVFANRPDLISINGFMRSFKSFLGKETGLKSYKINKPEKDYRINIDKSVKEVRPYTACAIVKGLNLTDWQIKDIINMQEKLALTLGRNRKKMGIGIYPLDKIKLPLIYTAKNKSEIKTIIWNKSVTVVKIEPVQETYTNTIKENWHQEFTTGENANEVDRLRASVIATLFFIRQSPQFTELFMDNFTTLLDVLSSDQLRPLFERIFNDTTELNDNEYIDNMTDHVSDVNSQSNDNLTEQDQYNINTLVSLGFQKNASIQAYLICNKNIELAASMLMDNN